MYELDVRGVESETQESSLDRLRMELAHFKEVRHSMEKIRDHLSVGMNEVRFNTADYCSTSETDGREGEQETEQMRRATQRLYGKLKEAEARHERESRVLEANQYSSELRESRKALWQSEEKVSLQDKQIEELQRLVARMEKEHQILVGRMQEREKQLEEMRAQNRDDEAHRHRSVQLEREVETLREKISHLGDMQQSQQRKVRQMIEQLQASRKQIEEKDLLIQQLQERVDCLESENRELQDHVEHLNCSKSTQQRSLPERSAQEQDGLSNRFPMGVKKPKALMRVLETQ
ncbi:tuftelin-like isoform X2 [Narcine bancroftii]|uniref:tuftelin-like isoform X2 n=1 Tax=Narcine bancroftii TaxID=1343680 RepID=UPI0038318C2D